MDLISPRFPTQEVISKLGSTIGVFESFNFCAYHYTYRVYLKPTNFSNLRITALTEVF